MLARWSLNRSDVANAIDAAVRAVLGSGLRTADLVAGGDTSPTGTRAFTDAVVQRLGAGTASGARP